MSERQAGQLPRHVAIIMDGNGRWAKKRHLPREAGHLAGVKAVRETVRAACDIGLENLTLFAFSSENWKRPKTEVGALMGLFRSFFRNDMNELVERGARVRIIGQRGRVAPDIGAMIEDVESRTLNNKGLNLTFAFDYGAQEEIAGAARELARAARDGRLDPESITPELFAARLFTSALPEPDLIIRTSGEHRLSNFLLWQSAYAELLFIDTLWPDFNREALEDALSRFAGRERRFGALDFGECGVSTQAQIPRGAVRSGTEMVLRILFGFFLAAIALAALFYDPLWFAGLTTLMSVFGAREWHRLVRSPQAAADAERSSLHIQTIVTALAIVAAVGVLLLHQQHVAVFGELAVSTVIYIAFGLLAIGAVASFVVALRRQDNPAWHGIGVLYLGIPTLALVGLRIYPPQGALLLLGMFLIVWSTDTGALVFGKLIGGARIAPRLSPGKTWAGTIGGSVTAALVFGVYIGLFGFDMLSAMAFAFVFSLAAHLGDLLESAIKRHFGRKDSGSMIPGHGGVLDRMDSTLLASVVLAILVFGLHLNPMFGGRV